jgi:hypothetical protein
MDYRKQQDLNLGFKSENDINQTLENVFGKLFNTKDNQDMGEYFEFDKYNDNFMIEIKTRRIIHNQYPTLIFGENKLRKGDELINQNPNLRIFYLWKCNDGIYGWEHRSTDYYVSQMGRYDRGRREVDDCVNIKQCNIKPLVNLLE